MAYSACRYSNVAEKLLTPRTYYSLGPTGLRAHFPRPKYWRKKCFGNWMLVSLLAREDKLMTQAGLDAYIIMRTFRLSFWIVLLLTIPGVCIVLPFYRYGFCNSRQHSSVSYCTQDARTLYCKHLCFNSTLKTSNYSAWTEAMKLEDCSCIDLFTSLNIPDTSPALWIPAAMGMYTTVVISWFLWRESREQVRIRVKYWLTRPPQLYTVLVQRVPAALQTQARLQRYFERLFGSNSVHKVTPVVNVAKETRKVLKQRQRMIQAEAESVYASVRQRLA